MPFRPQVYDALLIDGSQYRFTPHPIAKDMPYGQSGRRATVYQVETNDSTLLAFKVFTQSFRSPLIAEGASRIRPYAGVPGLQVCARLVITPERFESLLARHPDLKYACLMPWVSGETWQEVMLANHPLTRGQSLNLGFALVRVLATMEQKGLAHCDLSGPNIILPGLDNPILKSPVALVDVEEMFATNLPRPEKLSAGSPGYAHKTTSRGIWNIYADRFAGAIILAEMLSWYDEGIRSQVYGEQYFDPAEIHQDTERYRLMTDILEQRWGRKIAALFEQTWHSKTLEECPRFMEWGNAIFAEQKKINPEMVTSGTTFEEEVNPPLDGYQKIKIDTEETSANNLNTVEVLLTQASAFERQGLLHNALSLYEDTVVLVDSEDARNEIEIIISELKQKIFASKQDDITTKPPKVSNVVSNNGKSNYKRLAYLIFPMLVFAVIFLINSLISEEINSVGSPMFSEQINSAGNPMSAETTNGLWTNTPSVLYTQTKQTMVLPTQTLFINTPATSMTPTPPSDLTKDESGALMSYIPAGEFTMGSDDGESDEGPAHQVDLNGYYIDQYEVTNAQYKICVEEGACQPPDSDASFKRSSYYNNSTYENYPVINVNWDMANNFCEWRGARLPTEAEWEKAARGTDARLFPWGNELSSIYANYGKYVNDTTSVGRYEAGKSPYGVYDMSGNVWEWVADWYNIYPGGDPNAASGFGETFGEVRKVLRGGDFANDKKDILTYTRSANLPDRTSDIIGFRCAKDIK